MLSRWRKEYREGKFVADRRVKKVLDDQSAIKSDRLKALEQENTKLKVENDLLKKKPSGSLQKKGRNLRIYSPSPRSVRGGVFVPVLRCLAQWLLRLA
jgi:transposase-like protein